ncbi:MAG TPA: hypothetical protein VGM38_06440 [Pseudolysinimonas sp.]|jgi:hypothetical protein
MTTYQEPLQSRRAARQSERADSPPGGLPDPNAGNQPPASPPAPVSQGSAPLNPEPLNYATTSRPPLPQYDGQDFRSRRTAEVPGHADLPPTEALPRQDAPSYRPKDYSPEGRRSAVPNWAPSYEGTVEFQTQNRDQALAAASAPVAEGEHTMTRRELRALREADGITAVATDQTPVVAPNPVAAPVAQPGAPAPTPQGSTVAPPALVPPTPQASTRLDSALAEFDALAAGREPIVASPDAPAPLPGRRAAQQPVTEAPVAQAPLAAAPAEQSPVAAAPVAAAPPTPAPAPQEPQDSLSAFEALFAVPPTVASPPQQEQTPSAAAQLLAPPVVEAAPAPAPTQAPQVDPLLSAPAPQGAPALAPPPAAPVSRSTGPASVGHWSTQSDIDEAEQILETTISRSVGAGSGAITTSALVLPSVPERAIGGAMNGNGEILLTGSISLPHSFSATGAHPSQLDESDLDHLLDPGDHQVANTDSMPIRAVRAVSTHTATGAIIAPVKQKGTRGFTILIVAASAMAVVVVGLLVAGLMSGTL